MATIDLEDSSIHYKVQNQSASETIIFLHGVGLDHSEFNYVLPYFQNFKLVSYDIRWHGLSKGCFYANDEENWQALINDFITLIEQEKITNFHLVTHGIGSQLAVELISREFINPHSFTVLSTPFYYPQKVAEEGIKFRMEKIKGMTGRELGEWMIPQILETDNPDKHELVKSSFEKIDMDLYMDIFMLHARAISLEKLKKIKVPTLLLNGEFDVNYPVEINTLSANYLPDVRSKIIVGASNMVHIDQPKETAIIIEEFIQNHRYQKREKKVMPDFPYLSLLRQELQEKELLVRIDFLTVFEMRVNERVIQGKWNQRKAKELMAYLGYYGRTTKDVIYEALWPNASTSSAQNSLRVTLHHVRTLLKEAGIEDIIHADTQYVWLDEGIDIRCDVIEALNGQRTIPTNHLFSDMPVDWIMEIQYELEKRFDLV
ncbi:alpha/beta hydrolase [Ornithinibacillus halotolerans]|uniref:AB hydrolase-1 domain-containing protein n=1 Tax=Ornithinibacillus halotolerans TaxID=1274357 RepID=A0A916W9U4_9BACI|nr:alpha/beta hydrolase [Ornithinibacillus halotolerans]GGA78877.1 hypothetical protein GCM10008025_22930 [Ornithinibacillus halotolerans]